MKTMCPHSYHYNSVVATHALGHIMSCHKAIVVKPGGYIVFIIPYKLRSSCFPEI